MGKPSRGRFHYRNGGLFIVTVAYEGPDIGYIGRVRQAFNSAVTSDLKNSVYLERKDGRRIFLSDYVPPGKDPFGARFILSRTVDGQPFITAESGNLRFHAEYENKVPLDATSAGCTSRQTRSSSQTKNPFKLKLDMKFKVADMVYDGKLEY